MASFVLGRAGFSIFSELSLFNLGYLEIFLTEACEGRKKNSTHEEVGGRGERK